MSKFTTIKEIEQELQKGYTLARLRSGDDQALDRIRVLLRIVGNPHEKLRVVHVAGTSGKTSTSYYIAALLHAGGANKVGLTVSPHVRSFAERFQVNGKPMPEHELADHFSVFVDEIGSFVNQGTYFELLISFVYWMFDRIGVDYAVMETGLGGLHDCTNVAKRPDKVCVITDIGYDHTEILGDTIEKIAAQKAGIIHEQNAVFMVSQSDEVNAIVAAHAGKKQASLHVISNEILASSSTKLDQNIPDFQKKNWVLAKEVYSYVAKRDGLEIDINIEPKDVVVPGRMEIRKLSNGTSIVFDGAHNAQKVSTFVASFQKLFPGMKASVLLALKSGKDYESIVRTLAPITNDLIVTQFRAEQDLPLSSLTAETIASSASQYVKNVRVEVRSNVAFMLLLSSESEIKLVIGSIYLLGDLFEAGDIQ